MNSEDYKSWESRSSFGKRPIFENADDLWFAACEYFEWNHANPLYESKLVSYLGVSEIEKMPKMRAMTLAGLALFIGVSVEYFYPVRTRKGFVRVMEDIDAVIRTQKFEGAAADLLNPTLIARDLGLVDKQEIDAAVVSSVMVAPAKISPQEWVAREEAENEKRVSPEENDED